MSCCSAFGDQAEQQFNTKKAGQELARYRQKGLATTTRLLREGLAKSGALSGLLLDVGSGIGSLSFELLESGMTRAVAVDASSAYIVAAKEEAQRRNHSGEIQFVHGDFMTLTRQLPAANVVTLDRVVCCYPAFVPLLKEAIRHAEHCVALSYPRDVWYVRAGVALENGERWLRRNSFRTFVHSASQIEQVITQAGFVLLTRNNTLMWSVDVYIR